MTLREVTEDGGYVLFVKFRTVRRVPRTFRARARWNNIGELVEMCRSSSGLGFNVLHCATCFDVARISERREGRRKADREVHNYGRDSD